MTDQYSALLQALELLARHGVRVTSITLDQPAKGISNKIPGPLNYVNIQVEHEDR